MKRIRLLFVAIFACVLTIFVIFGQATNVYAATESDLSFELNDDGQSYSVSDCKKSANGELVIPATYNGKPVTAISSSAFYDCKKLTRITIPDSVHQIDHNFIDCEALQYNIYENAAYLGNDNNPYMVLVRTISDDISSCTIHDDTRIICGNAFSDCKNITNITLPSGISVIDGYTFDGCEKLTTIIIPTGVTCIGMSAFEGCTSLSNITIPNSVTQILTSAFEGCTSLASINIPSGVTDINSGAFKDCINLTTIDIPASVTYIGPSAFEGCKNLSGIWVNPANTYLRSDEYGVLFIYHEGQWILQQAPGAIKGHYSIPDNVSVINGDAFFGCVGLTSITIPDSVTEIYSDAFGFCTGLTDVIIGNGVNKIHSYAFEDCTNLANIIIGKNVTIIDRDAFRGCGFTNLVLPNSVSALGKYAFSNCKKLESLFIPGSVTSVGAGAFDGCYSLTNVTLGNGFRHIVSEMFNYCPYITNITLPGSIQTIDYKAFFNCSQIKNVYYELSQQEWNGISIKSGNEHLTHATITYNYSIPEPTAPTIPEHTNSDSDNIKQNKPANNTAVIIAICVTGAAAAGVGSIFILKIRKIK